MWLFIKNNGIFPFGVFLFQSFRSSFHLKKLNVFDNYFSRCYLKIIFKGFCIFLMIFFNNYLIFKSNKNYESCVSLFYRHNWCDVYFFNESVCFSSFFLSFFVINNYLLIKIWHLTEPYLPNYYIKITCFFIRNFLFLKALGFCLILSLEESIFFP